jgi:phage FluMu gp28-like protein
MLSFDRCHFIGVDLGKKQDYSVVAVVRRDRDKLRVVHLKRFRLGTEYSAVIGYVKVLCEKLNVVRVCIDRTGVGEYVTEDLERAVTTPCIGVVLTLPLKQEILGYMKKQMEDGGLRIPYSQDLISEINVERFHLTKTGQIQFSHPEGTHDDRLWALALAVYTSRVDASKPVVVSF